MEAFGARVFLPTAAAGRAAQAGNGVGCRQLLRAHASPSEPNQTARIASAMPFSAPIASGLPNWLLPRHRCCGSQACQTAVAGVVRSPIMRMRRGCYLDAAAKQRLRLLQRRAPEGCVAVAGALPKDLQT